MAKGRPKVKKKVCQWCGKRNAKPMHEAHCSKKPKNGNESVAEMPAGVGPAPETMTAPAPETQTVAVVVENAVAAPVADAPAEVVATPPISTAPIGSGQMCHRCGLQPVVKLNAMDWRCPVCGDYEVKRVKK
jgi:hypothetical protein